MTYLDNRSKPSSGAVDDILHELKAKPASGTAATSRSVDDILAEMGMAAKKRPAFPPPPAAKQPASTPPAQPQPKAVAKAPTQEGPVAAPPQPEAPAAPAPEDPATQARTAEFDIVAPQAGAAGGETAIWRTDSLRPPQAPRMGKAAALDKVDPDKFTGDTELLSWFAEEEALTATKKDQKKAAREKKKRQAAELKEQKRQGRETEPLPEDDAFDGGTTMPFAAVSAAGEAPLEAEPEFFGMAAHEETASYVEETVLEAAAIDDDGTRVFTAVSASETVPETPLFEDADDFFDPASITIDAAPPPAPAGERHDTQSYELGGVPETPEKTPTAAYTQEFESSNPELEKLAEGMRSLYVDDMVDDRFRDFFSETVVVSREDIEREAKAKKRRNKKSRSAILTGEFAKLAEMAEQAEQTEQADMASEAAGMATAEAAAEEWEDYERPQDAPAIEKDIAALRTTLTRRCIGTGIITLLLLWMGFAFTSGWAIPAFASPTENPLVFAIVYVVLLVAAMAVNFTTVATGLIGLAGEPTVDTTPALASLAALLQGIVLLVNAATGNAATATLFGSIAALLLTFNALGKRVRAVSILRNFQLASAGFDHSAAYVLGGGQDVAYNITSGLEEEYPTLLVSRPTALVKGFLRQSFSQRWTDRIARIMGWALLAAALVMAAITYFLTDGSGALFSALSAFAAILCIAAPLSSTLVSAIPSLLLQSGTSRIGAVVPGWSAIEELGQVNVVMANARDLFPPNAVQLKGIKTFEKERIDIAILYAASVLIAGCDTLRDIFLGVIQGKSDMLYKVESLVKEPGRGFNAWVENNRVVIGNREMLQKHGVQPPPIETEMKYVPESFFPVYLAVAGRLTAMFIIGYSADAEVEETLEGLVKSGVSLLVTSDDMNVTGELVEQIFGLPHGVIKVLGQREMDIMKPLTAYLPESEGVMTHMGTFASFIGGMRAAAGCAASEKMSAAVQIASAVLAVLLCGLLVFSGTLSGLNIVIALLYQAGWTLLICALPLARRY